MAVKKDVLWCQSNSSDGAQGVDGLEGNQTLLTGIVKEAGRKMGDTFKMGSAPPAHHTTALEGIWQARSMSAITTSKLTILHVSR